jgi:hypothetical protein
MKKSNSFSSSIARSWSAPLEQEDQQEQSIANLFNQSFT